MDPQLLSSRTAPGRNYGNTNGLKYKIEYKYKIQNTKYKIQNTKYKIQKTKDLDTSWPSGLPTNWLSTVTWGRTGEQTVTFSRFGLI